MFEHNSAHKIRKDRVELIKAIESAANAHGRCWSYAPYNYEIAKKYYNGHDNLCDTCNNCPILNVCGGGNIKDAPNLSKVPLLIQHGDKDFIVPISESQKVVNAVKNFNFSPEIKKTVASGQ